MGDPIASFYGYQVEGVISTAEELTALNSKAPGGVYYDKITKPGDFKFRDVNGDGFISELDKVIIGSPHSQIHLWLQHGYELCRLRHEHGVERHQRRETVPFRQDLPFRFTIHHAQCFYIPGQVAAGRRHEREPRAGQNGNLNHRTFRLVHRERRLPEAQDFTIGSPCHWENRDNIIGKTFSNIRAYVAAQNLLTITKYKGYDPEVSNPDGNPADILGRGLDAGVAVPQPRTFLLGVQIGFG